MKKTPGNPKRIFGRLERGLLGDSLGPEAIRSFAALNSEPKGTSQRLGSEGIGQKLDQAAADHAAVRSDETYGSVGAEFTQDLQAFAVDGVRALGVFDCNHETDVIAKAGRASCAHGDRFGQRRTAVGGVVVGYAREGPGVAFLVFGREEGGSGTFRVGNMAATHQPHEFAYLALIAFAQVFEVLCFANGAGKQIAYCGAADIVVVVDNVEENRRAPELVEHLTAESAGRSARIFAAENGYGKKLRVAEKGCGRGGVAFGADSGREVVVLDIATREDPGLACGVGGIDCGSYGEVGMETETVAGRSVGSIERRANQFALVVVEIAEIGQDAEWFTHL